MEELRGIWPTGAARASATPHPPTPAPPLTNTPTPGRGSGRAAAQDSGPPRSPARPLPAALAWGWGSASGSDRLRPPGFCAATCQNTPSPERRRGKSAGHRDKCCAPRAQGARSPEILDAAVDTQLNGLAWCCQFPEKITPSYGKCVTLGTSGPASFAIRRLISLRRFYPPLRFCFIKQGEFQGSRRLQTVTGLQRDKGFAGRCQGVDFQL